MSIAKATPRAMKAVRNLFGVDTIQKASESQVAGSHYSKLKIQPMEYSMANSLNSCQHTAIKYITRYKDKNGEQDIDKAIHTLMLLKEFEYGNKK